MIGILYVLCYGYPYLTSTISGGWLVHISGRPYLGRNPEVRRTLLPLTSFSAYY